MTLLDELKSLLVRYPSAKMIQLDRGEIKEIIALLEVLRDGLR